MRIIDADAYKSRMGGVYGEYWEEVLDDMPTIDAVEVVHGEWIPKPQIGWEETWVCSICGEKTTSSFIGTPRYEYCPMCGAKMDGERKESE